jgi:hypothetical protein
MGNPAEKNDHAWAAQLVTAPPSPFQALFAEILPMVFPFGRCAFSLEPVLHFFRRNVCTL